MKQLKDPGKALKEGRRLLIEITALDRYLFSEAHAADLDFATDTMVYLEKARKSAQALVDKLSTINEPKLLQHA